MPHTCADCGDTFTPARADAAYCSSACRQRAYRNRNAPSRNGSPGRATRNAASRNASSSTATRNTSSVTQPDDAAIDWDSIPGTQREKLDTAKEFIRKKFERDYNTRLQAEAAQYRKECDQTLADYKAKLKAEADEKERTTRATGPDYATVQARIAQQEARIEQMVQSRLEAEVGKRVRAEALAMVERGEAFDLAVTRAVESRVRKVREQLRAQYERSKNFRMRAADHKRIRAALHPDRHVKCENTEMMNEALTLFNNAAIPTLPTKP
jgi:hypothetical protein